MPDETQSASHAFQPVASTRDDGPGAGPAWHQPIVKASLNRISNATTVEHAHAQAATEQLIVLHSIRRILLWSALVIPAVLVAIGVVLVVAGSAPSSCGIYSTRC